MKNILKLIGVIAIITVIGFSMVACDDDKCSCGPIVYNGNPAVQHCDKGGCSVRLAQQANTPRENLPPCNCK